MTMNRAQHPKAHVDRLYLKKCEGGRGLIRLEDCVQVKVHSLEKYLSTSKEKILKDVAAESLKTTSMEEVKKKYIKSIEKSMKENFFTDSLE